MNITTTEENGRTYYRMTANSTEYVVTLNSNGMYEVWSRRTALAGGFPTLAILTASKMRMRSKALKAMADLIEAKTTTVH